MLKKLKQGLLKFDGLAIFGREIKKIANRWRHFFEVFYIIVNI